MSGTVKLLFAGDTFPVEKNLRLFADGDIKALFGEQICDMFAKADYSVCNLEGCLTNSVKPVKKVGPSVKAPPDTLCGLKKLGINAVTMANTHTFDFGREGHADMCRALESYGIEHFGTGENENSIKTHITAEIKGRKITLYTVTELFDFNTPDAERGGANGYDEYAVCNELRKLKAECDLLVVLYHGGAEMIRYNTPRIRRRFHRMADCGADIVISQHTHAVGFEERYNGSYMLYGQGNFCFNLSKTVSEFTATGLLLEVGLSDSGFEVKKHIVRRTEQGCTYDEAQDMSVFDELTRLHERLIAGDREAAEIFAGEYSKYTTGKWQPRLMRVFRGTNSDDEKALAQCPPEEVSAYLNSRYTKTQLMAISMMLQNDEFIEIALDFIRQAIMEMDKE